ncbi:MAG: hypothetical protein AAB534_01185 [Patescibacteria group bacterium]
MAHRTYNTVWAGRFKCGDIVRYRDRLARVVAFPADAVPFGCVPILHRDELGCIMKVPADVLERLPQKPMMIRHRTRAILDLLFLLVLVAVFTVLAQTR